MTVFGTVDYMSKDENTEKSSAANEIIFLFENCSPKSDSRSLQVYSILTNLLRFIYRLLAVVYIVRGYFPEAGIIYEEKRNCLLSQFTLDLINKKITQL